MAFLLIIESRLILEKTSKETMKMLTKKQVFDVLNNPSAYSRSSRKEAVKAGIKMLDEAAIAEEAKKGGINLKRGVYEKRMG